MDNKKFLLGTLIGGILLFFLGFVIYAILFENFFAAHAGIATNVMKTEMQFWPIALGNFSMAALLSYVFLKWAKVSSFTDGLKAASLIGLLTILNFDLIMYDTTNFMDLTGTLVDVVLFTVMTGLAGGVIGAVIGMGNK
jgi:hypothetical protein